MSKKIKKDSEECLPFIRNDLFIIPSSGLEKPFLLGSKCSKCGRVFFPKRSVCPDCLEEGTMGNLRLSNKGKLHVGVIAHAAPVGFKHPYVVGYVDLPEGVRIFSQIKDAKICEDFLQPGTEMLIPGIEMELIVEKIREDDEGNDVIGYKFAPIKKVLKCNKEV